MNILKVNISTNWSTKVQHSMTRVGLDCKISKEKNSTYQKLTSLAMSLQSASIDEI